MNERPVEYAFALRVLASEAPRTVLDVGPGRTSWPHLLAGCGFVVTAVDEVTGYWGRGYFNRHYHVLHDDITASRLRGAFDSVSCISVLEHIPEYGRAVSEMRRLLALGGLLVLTVPFCRERYIPDVYALPGVGYGRGAPYICQVFSKRELDAWLAEGFAVERMELFEVFTGDLWAHGERLSTPRLSTIDERHHLMCVALRRLR